MQMNIFVKCSFDTNYEKQTKPEAVPLFMGYLSKLNHK